MSTVNPSPAQSILNSPTVRGLLGQVFTYALAALGYCRYCGAPLRGAWHRKGDMKPQVIRGRRRGKPYTEASRRRARNPLRCKCGLD